MQTVTIDGAMGEGGGQVLRTSVSLAVVTGQRLEISGIRARRPKPGLAAQHLTAVQAAAAICGGQVEGASLGATALRFTPGPVQAGDYSFDIGTAGSTALVLQTILPPLILAAAPSRVMLRGGTHNPAAPPFEMLTAAFFPRLARMGARVEATLRRVGFFPAGGGEVEAHIAPVSRLQPLVEERRGPLRAIKGRILLAGLPEKIAQREKRLLEDALANAQVEIVTCPAAGQGNVMLVEVDHSDQCEVFTAFGQARLRPEAITRGLIDRVRDFLGAEVPVGPYLADQLVLPLALAGAGRVRTVTPTAHTRTQLEVLRHFMAEVPSLTQESERVWVLGY